MPGSHRRKPPDWSRNRVSPPCCAASKTSPAMMPCRRIAPTTRASRTAADARRLIGIIALLETAGFTAYPLPEQRPSHLDLAAILRPADMERALAIDAAIGMGAEIIAQALQQIGRTPRPPQPVEIGQRRSEGGNRNTTLHRQHPDLAPGRLGFHHRITEVILQQQPGRFRMRRIDLAQAVEGSRADDAATAPDGGDQAGIEVPMMLGR